MLWDGAGTPHGQQCNELQIYSSLTTSAEGSSAAFKAKEGLWSRVIVIRQIQFFIVMM